VEQLDSSPKLGRICARGWLCGCVLVGQFLYDKVKSVFGKSNPRKDDLAIPVVQAVESLQEEALEADETNIEML
jgi:hypothetical protein